MERQGLPCECRCGTRRVPLRTAEATERLSCSPHWVWTAIDPESKLLLSVQVGERTLAMAQAVLHQIVQLLVPGCVLLLLRAYLSRPACRYVM